MTKSYYRSRSWQLSPVNICQKPGTRRIQSFQQLSLGKAWRRLGPIDLHRHFSARPMQGEPNAAC